MVHKCGEEEDHDLKMWTDLSLYFIISKYRRDFKLEKIALKRPFSTIYIGCLSGGFALHANLCKGTINEDQSQLEMSTSGHSKNVF